MPFKRRLKEQLKQTGRSMIKGVKNTLPHVQIETRTAADIESSNDDTLMGDMREEMKHRLKGKAVQSYAHTHDKTVPVKDNPLCNHAVADRLHALGLQHSTFVDDIHNTIYNLGLKQQKVVRATYSVSSEYKKAMKFLQIQLNNRHLEDYTRLANFVTDTNPSTGHEVANELANIKADTTQAIKAFLDTYKKHKETFGDGDEPNRNQIIKKISQVKTDYFSQIEQLKATLDAALTDNPKRTVQKNANWDLIQKFGNDANAHRIVIVTTFCPSVKNAVLAYQSDVVQEAIKRQDKQASLNLMQAPFKALSETLSSLESLPMGAGAPAASAATAISGVFDVLKAYQGMKEPVPALQGAVKFMVEVVLDQVKDIEKQLANEQAMIQSTMDQYIKRYCKGFKR